MSKLYKAVTAGIISLLLWLWLIWLVTPVSAQVVINEVLPQPSTGSEWVELVNIGSTPIVIEDWTLWDQLSTPSKMYLFIGEALGPGARTLAEISSSKLNNAGDGVTLKDATGETVDTMSYTNSQVDMSWARLPDGTGSWVIAPPSLGAPNPLPSPSPSPSLAPTPTPTPSSTPSPSPLATPPASDLTALTPAQLSPCPSTGNQEWVSLTNTGELDIAEQTWKIIDASGQTRLVTTDLPAGQTTILAWSGSLLNNSGDSIQVISASNFVVLSAPVPTCSQAQVFTWLNHAWQVAAGTPTPATATTSGSTNTQPAASPTILGANTAVTSSSLAVPSSPVEQQEALSPLPLTWSVPSTTLPQPQILTLTPPALPVRPLIWWLLGSSCWSALAWPAFRRLQQAYQYQLTEQMVQLFRANA